MKNELRIVLLLLCLCPMMHLFGQDALSALGNIHSVVKGETWESIAANHGISALELHAANPDIRKKKLKKGTLLVIPHSTRLAETTDVTEVLPEPAIRTAISDLKVGVLLPFSDVKMVEFYRGFLMAADSVRKAGVNLDIHTWDSGTSTTQIEQLLPKLVGLDVLFGPVSTIQIPAVAEACREQGIRLVLPFWNEQSLQDYPLVYNATAPTSLVYENAAKSLLNYYADRNFVIVHSGNDDSRGKALTETLTKNLAGRAGVSKVLELEGDDFAYQSAFNQFRDNMILLDDSSIRSLNILLARLKDFHRGHSEYRISLIGYPEWQEETGRLLGDFFAFNTYIISSYYYNVLDDKTKRFQRTYEKSFRTPIAQNNPRYAALGFDLGYYFLSGISSLGDTFEQMQGNLHQEPYQNWYKFERTATGMSFFNSFVQFIHFTPDSKIELVR